MRREPSVMFVNTTISLHLFVADECTDKLTLTKLFIVVGSPSAAIVNLALNKSPMMAIPILFLEAVTIFLYLVDSIVYPWFVGCRATL